MDLDTRIQNAEKRQQPRITRNDEDMTLYLLEHMNWILNSKGKPIPGVEQITLNDPKTFADRIITLLGTAERRYDILAAKEEFATTAEEFLKYHLNRAEENLMYQSMFPLEESLDFGSCLRGTIAARGILKRDGNKWYTDIVPIDTYNLTYEPGKRGALFTRIKSKKSAEDVSREHGIDIAESDEVEVEDIYTVDENILKINGKEARTPVKMPFNHNVIIVVPCPTTPRIAGRSDAIQHEAESIYSSVRNMYRVLNKEASAWRTQNMMGILPPIQFISKDGRKSKVPPFGVAAVMNIKFGEEYKGMPIKDVSASFQQFFGQIMARIQRATLANIDYGDLSFELSALAIKRLEAAKDQILLPRLKAKRFLTRVLAYNLIEQFMMNGYPCDLEGMGEESQFKASDFKRKTFQINVDYFASSPEESIADMTIANTAKNLGFPEEWIWKNICHIENWKELKRMRDRERIEAESETVRKLRYARSLLESGEEDDELEAELVLEEIGLILDQQGNITRPQLPGGNKQKTLPQPASQPQLPLGLTMPPVSTPLRSSEEKVQREENRRERIYQSEKSSKRG